MSLKLPISFLVRSTAFWRIFPESSFYKVCSGTDPLEGVHGVHVIRVPLLERVMGGVELRRNIHKLRRVHSSTSGEVHRAIPSEKARPLSLTVASNTPIQKPITAHQGETYR